MNGPCQSCSQPAQDGSRWCRTCDPPRQVEQAVFVAKRLYELHERGPIGKIEAHRIARTAFVTCPVCAEPIQ